ncbi:DUF2530 domain-containing protein [Streptomyces sp. NRRL F-5135]|uniref:DUF2530 domain-containing protein n=1 Tax=Streptomyces sp. NRRL F-5135 TaxID=1463858 RepID=UPI000A77FC67|nr:DUF2530 domain-containing protein [Streptomyces sp. NRRL F-5135]
MTGSLMSPPRHEAPEPLEGPVVGTVTGGTIIWFVLFLVQLPFYGWYSEHGHAWWIWTCLAGGGLGLIGLWYVRGRDAAIKRASAAAAEKAEAGRHAEESVNGANSDDAAKS